MTVSNILFGRVLRFRISTFLPRVFQALILLWVSHFYWCKMKGTHRTLLNSCLGIQIPCHVEVLILTYMKMKEVFLKWNRCKKREKIGLNTKSLSVIILSSLASKSLCSASKSWIPNFAFKRQFRNFKKESM